jgi:ParB family chromosome partitioning protein
MPRIVPAAAEVREAESLVKEARAMRLKAEAAEEKSSPYRWREADAYAALAREGWSQRRIAEECETNASTVNRFIQAVLRYRNTESRPSFWQAYSEVTGETPKTAHVSHNSGENEWYTPPEYLEAARAVLGGIDLDPASSEKAQETVKAGTFYTARDDGLSKAWKAGSVWLNPPYVANLVERFVSKLCGHALAGDVAQAVLLVNNATETQWFQEAWRTCAAVCFPAGRVRFLDESGEPANSPLQGQAIFYFGNQPSRFVEAFQGFGECAVLVGAAAGGQARAE